MDEYYIEAGVHRAVAFRENGIRVIPAMLYEPGCPPSIPLDQVAIVA